MIWFVTANSNSCRIFQYKKADKTLTLVKELSNPLAKLKGTELVSDRPGHYGAEGGARGAYVGHSDPHENEVDVFSLEVARALENGKNTNQYAELILAAQPHMSGAINKHIGDHIKNCIKHNIIKDYTRLNELELLAVLKELRLS